MLLIECMYAPYRETNSPLTFIPLLQHEAQSKRYRRLQRHGLLVVVALGRPTAIITLLFLDRFSPKLAET